MQRSPTRWLALGLVMLLMQPRSAAAYSVLAHEAMVDAAWELQLLPTLKQRFPRASPSELQSARAYAYGGSLIQDLGYYPFGSHFFSNLVHYVRSGDFIEALLREAHDLNEYAFALGALAHYSSDNAGHPVGVNRAVPLIYPKLAAKYGPEVLYAESPARHVMVEFAFDVLEVGRGSFKSDAYQDLVGFKVATAALERAFRSTYGLELTDVFGDADLAIGTFRHAASETIPQITRQAWMEKRDEILAATPDAAEHDVVFSMTRAQYEQTYGTNYRKPGLLARFVVTIFKIVPKFGPFKPLAFEPLTPSTERMFLDSFEQAAARYRQSLVTLRRGPLSLRNTDLDTGEAPVAGVNPLADTTYDQLLDRLAKTQFVGVSPALRRAINDHYASERTATPQPGRKRSAQRKAAQQLAALNAH